MTVIQRQMAMSLDMQTSHARRRGRAPWLSGLRLFPKLGPGYWVFLVHVAVAMELMLLAPFMKLAHAVYRPVALFFVALAQSSAEGDG